MHVHFKDLDFIITTEGELAMALAAVQPLPSFGVDTIIGVLEELQLRALKAHAPRSD